MFNTSSLILLVGLVLDSVVNKSGWLCVCWLSGTVWTVDGTLAVVK